MRYLYAGVNLKIGFGRDEIHFRNILIQRLEDARYKDGTIQTAQYNHMPSSPLFG